MSTTIRVAQAVFDSESSTGFTISDEGFKGWGSGSVGVRRTSFDEPQAHGAFDAAGFRTSRVFAVSGLCFAGSAEKLGWYEAQLNSLLADGGTGQVFVSHAGVETWAWGRLAAAPDFDISVPGAIAEYQIQFWFADPRKYGDLNAGVAGVSPGEVLSHHYGNFEATSILTVTGSAPGYTIYGPDGRAYVVTVPVVTGHPHVIDMKTSFLSIDGVKQFGAVARADTWTVPPGQVVSQTLLVTSGAAVLSEKNNDTYI